MTSLLFDSLSKAPIVGIIVLLALLFVAFAIFGKVPWPRVFDLTRKQRAALGGFGGGLLVSTLALPIISPPPPTPTPVARATTVPSPTSTSDVTHFITDIRTAHGFDGIKGAIHPDTNFSLNEVFYATFTYNFAAWGNNPPGNVAGDLLASDNKTLLNYAGAFPVDGSSGGNADLQFILTNASYKGPAIVRIYWCETIQKQSDSNVSFCTSEQRVVTEIPVKIM